MILRTPPPQRKRRAEAIAEVDEQVGDQPLVVYNDTAPVSHLEPSHDHGMVCTYQCRQMVKSEFMDAYSNAEKQILDYQSRLNMLTNDSHHKEVENKTFQDKICFLEQELAASKGREKALEERLLKDVDDYMVNYRSEAKRSSELEIKLKEEVELRKNAEASAATAVEKAASLQQMLSDISDKLERQNDHLFKELSEAQEEARLTCSSLNRELERMRLRADGAMEELELEQKQSNELRDQLNEVLAEKSLIEQKLLSSSTMSHANAASEEQALVKHLQDALHNYEVEVQEARKLRSNHENINLLREKLLDEKVRRERAEEQLLQLQEMKLNANDMKDELEILKPLVNDVSGISSFEEIPKKVAALQQEAIDNMKKLGEMKEGMKDLEMALELANLTKERSDSEYALLQEKNEALMLEVSQLKVMLKLVTEERDSFKRDALTSNKQWNLGAGGETITESLPEKMESALAKKDYCIKELEACLQEQREVINHKHEELRLINEKLNLNMKRIKSLEHEGDRLRSEISLLESKLGHGDYSSANTKVLRMVNTLTVDNEAKHTIEALRAELQKTHAKLRAVEELKGRSDAENLIDADVSEKLAQLKGQIATLEKREDRYKMVFADKISVFRRACCSLFGYKITMDDQQRPNGIPVTRFTLQSIYAQTDEEKLEFEYESGNTNIMVNNYTSQPDISHQVDIFIRKLNSIPAFTANLTVESFNKRTLN